MGLRSNSKHSGFPAPHPAPPTSREKEKQLLLASSLGGIGKLTGQCSGLDTFDPEAPRPELRRRIAGKPSCDAPSARVAGPLPHPSQQRPGPAVKLSDPQDPRRRRARCHVTPPPPKHRRNAGRRKAFAPARLGWPRRGRVPRARAGRGGGKEGGLGGGPERATKASAPPLRRAQTGGGTVFAARGRGGESGVPAAPTAGPGRSAAPQSPRGAQARTGLPPPRGARAGPPARSPLALSDSLARPPSWIGATSPRAAAAAFPLFPAPRRRRRRLRSPQLPIRALSAVDLVSPQKSPVCYSRCGGVVTGWSPGVRERGPRLQRSCNPNPPSGGIFHTPMAPLQTWVPTALCWPRGSLPC